MSLKILAFALTAAFAGSLAFASESTETRAPKRYRQAPQAQQEQPQGDYQDYDQDYQQQGGYGGGYAQGGVVAGGAVVGGGCCGPAALPVAPIPQVGCCGGGYPPAVLPVNPVYPVQPIVPLVCTVVRLPTHWIIYQARNGVTLGPVSQGAYIHLGMAIQTFRAQGCVFTNL